MNLVSQSQVMTAEVLPVVGVALRFPVGSRIKRKRGKEVRIRGGEVSHKPGSFWIINPESKRACGVESAEYLLHDWELAPEIEAANGTAEQDTERGLRIASEQENDRLRGERDELKVKLNRVTVALQNVVDGNDIAQLRNLSLETWPTSTFRKQAIAAIAAQKDKL